MGRYCFFLGHALKRRKTTNSPMMSPMINPMMIKIPKPPTITTMMVMCVLSTTRIIMKHTCTLYKQNLECTYMYRNQFCLELGWTPELVVSRLESNRKHHQTLHVYTYCTATYMYVCTVHVHTVHVHTCRYNPYRV